MRQSGSGGVRRGPRSEIGKSTGWHYHALAGCNIVCQSSIGISPHPAFAYAAISGGGNASSIRGHQLRGRIQGNGRGGAVHVPILGRTSPQGCPSGGGSTLGFRRESWVSSKTLGFWSLRWRGGVYEVPLRETSSRQGSTSEAAFRRRTRSGPGHVGRQRGQIFLLPRGHQA